MADSESTRITHFAPVIQLNAQETIFLDMQEIGRMPASEADALDALENALAARHRGLTPQEQNSKDGALINLVFDRNTDYQKIERIMASSAKMGFTQFKFIVRGEH